MKLGVNIPGTPRSNLITNFYEYAHYPRANNPHVQLSSLWYADDSACFANSFDNIITIIDNIILLFQQYGIELGYNKCAIMPMFKATIPDQHANNIHTRNGTRYYDSPHGSYSIPIVEKYKYLGNYITHDLDMNNMVMQHLNRQQHNINNAFHICKNPYLSSLTKKQIIYTWIIPRIMYNCEVWGFAILGDLPEISRPKGTSEAGQKLIDTFDQLSRCVIGIAKNDTTATAKYTVQRESCISTPKDIITSATIRFYLRNYYNNEEDHDNIYHSINTMNQLLHNPYVFPARRIGTNNNTNVPQFEFLVPYSLGLNIAEIRHIFGKYDLSQTHPVFYKMLHSHTNNITGWPLIRTDHQSYSLPSRRSSYKTYNNNTAKNSELLLRQLQSLTILNTHVKPDEVIIAKELIDRGNIEPHLDKLNKNKHQQEDYSGKRRKRKPKPVKIHEPRQFDIYYEQNRAAGSEHNFARIYHLFPQYYEGFSLLQRIRTASYRFTHRLINVRTSKIKCIGCHSHNGNTLTIEDTAHLLLKCKKWEKHRIDAYNKAYNIITSNTYIQQSAQHLKTKHMMMINLKADVTDIRQLEEIGDYNFLLPPDLKENTNNTSYYINLVRKRAKTYGISSILSDHEDPRSLKLHQPVLWLWLAIFLQEIHPLRARLLAIQKEYSIIPPKNARK